MQKPAIAICGSPLRMASLVLDDFSITPYSQVAEQESNDTRDDAQEVLIPTVLDARLEKVADLDWLAFDGQKGQLISITCRSLSLDGSVQPVFTVFDPSGRELVHSTPNELEPRGTCQLPTKRIVSVARTRSILSQRRLQ